MASTSAAQDTQTQASGSPCVQSGHTTILKMPNGETRSLKIDKDATISLGRYGAFHANALIGQKYGITYEIVDKKLVIMPPRTMNDLEDTEATNELINDGQFVQPLTSVEIEALKKTGVHASEIIKKQVEQHATYQLKTEYSKEKYKKRKEAKFSKFFTVVEPTLFNICEYWFNKDKTRIRDIRVDALSQMLTLGNIRPGGRYLVVDDASGIIVASVLDRIGGNGRVMTVCNVDGPPTYPALTHMNLPKSDIESTLVSLNWATIEEDYVQAASGDPEPEQGRSDKQKSRLNKRKAASNTLQALRDELFAGEFEGLLIASEYDSLSIMEKLSPYLGGSASIVVHSAHLQSLSELQSALRDKPEYLGPSVTEGWLRRYQVLPGRTHPSMTTSGSGGYLLHTIKVFDDPAANSVMAHRIMAKRAKQSATATPNPADSSTTDSSAAETASQP